jgi:hypothetical protein
MSKPDPLPPAGDYDFSAWHDDAVAFITMALENPGLMRPGEIVSTFCHDLGGIIRKERCFCPRMDGSAKALAKLRARKAGA